MTKIKTLLLTLVAMLASNSMFAQSVARIGTTEYATLAEAVAAAQVGATITVIADDYSLSDGSEIEINKSLTITGEVNAKGEPLHTIYGKSTVTGYNDLFIKGSGTVTLSNLKIKNFGNDKATDPSHAPIYVSSTFTGTVNFTNLYISDFNRGGIFLYGGGTFNVDNCYIDCANSRSGAFTKGIEIKGSANGTISNTFICNMERSSTTYSTAGIEIYGNGSVLVDNCTIVSNNDDHSTTKGTYGIVSQRVGAHDPSGGSLHINECFFSCTNACLSVSDSENYSIVVDESSFDNYIATWSATSTITINSGDYAEDVYADAGTIIINGGEFSNFAPDTESGSIIISGGTFDADPSEYVADGYAAVHYDDDENEYWVVGKLKETDLAPKTVTEEEVVYTATLQVVDEDDNILSEKAVTVTVVGSDAGTNSIAETALAQVDVAKVVETVVESTELTDGDNVQVTIVVTSENQSGNNNETLTFDVNPEAIVTVNNNQVGTLKLENDDLAENATFTFTLPVTNTVAANGKVILVHKSSDANYSDETSVLDVEGTVDNYFVTVTTTHFSTFELKAATEGDDYVTVHLTGSLATFCPAFDVDFGSDIEAYVAVSGDQDRYTNNLIVLQRVYTAKAGEGILLRGAVNADYEFVKTNNAVSLVEGNLLKGVLVATTIYMDEGDNMNFYLTNWANNNPAPLAFYQAPSDGVEIPAGKAYLQLANDDAYTVPAYSGASGAKGLTFVFEGETTDIKSFGQFNNVQFDNNVIYDLQGRRVQNPTRGIYVVNGKKVVLR